MSKRGYALDMKPNGFGVIELGHHATARYADPLTDKLYLVLDADMQEPSDPYLPISSTAPVPASPYVNIYEFDSPNAYGDLVYRYKGKLNILPNERAFAYCQVRAADYDNLILNIYADDELLVTRTVTSREPFTLPMTDMFNHYEIELIGTSSVRSVQIVEDIRELT